MTQIVQRAVIERFYAALGERDYTSLADLLADDIQWAISGPVDLLAFCGIHRGKANVLELLSKTIISVIGTRRIVQEQVLADGNHGAALCRVSGWNDKKQAIGYRVAHFVKFRDGLAYDYISVLDTFDAVEQVTGRRIGISPGLAPTELDSELFAV